MNWDEWAGEYLERDMRKMVRQRQHGEDEKKPTSRSSIFSWKTGRSKDRFEKKSKADQVSEWLEYGHDRHWYAYSYSRILLNCLLY